MVYNLLDDNQNTLLHSAINEDSMADVDKNQRVSMVKHLLTHSVNANKANMYSMTPLHLATRVQDRELVRLFLQSGADARAADSMGMTPLHYAVMGLMKKCEDRPVGELVKRDTDKSVSSKRVKTIIGLIHRLVNGNLDKLPGGDWEHNTNAAISVCQSYIEDSIDKFGPDADALAIMDKKHLAAIEDKWAETKRVTDTTLIKHTIDVANSWKGALYGNVSKNWEGLVKAAELTKSGTEDSGTPVNFVDRLADFYNGAKKRYADGIGELYTLLDIDGKYDRLAIQKINNLKRELASAKRTKGIMKNIENLINASKDPVKKDHLNDAKEKFSDLDLMYTLKRDVLKRQAQYMGALIGALRSAWFDKDDIRYPESHPHAPSLDLSLHATGDVLNIHGIDWTEEDNEKFRTAIDFETLFTDVNTDLMTEFPLIIDYRKKKREHKDLDDEVAKLTAAKPPDAAKIAAKTTERDAAKTAFDAAETALDTAVKNRKAAEKDVSDVSENMAKGLQLNRATLVRFLNYLRYVENEQIITTVKTKVAGEKENDREADDAILTSGGHHFNRHDLNTFAKSLKTVNALIKQRRGEAEKYIKAYGYSDEWQYIDREFAEIEGHYSIVGKLEQVLENLIKACADRDVAHWAAHVYMYTSKDALHDDERKAIIERLEDAENDNAWWNIYMEDGTDAATSATAADKAADAAERKVLLGIATIAAPANNLVAVRKHLDDATTDAAAEIKKAAKAAAAGKVTLKDKAAAAQAAKEKLKNIKEFIDGTIMQIRDNLKNDPVPDHLVAAARAVRAAARSLGAAGAEAETMSAIMAAFSASRQGLYYQPINIPALRGKVDGVEGYLEMDPDGTRWAILNAPHPSLALKRADYGGFISTTDLIDPREFAKGGKEKTPQYRRPGSRGAVMAQGNLLKLMLGEIVQRNVFALAYGASTGWSDESGTKYPNKPLLAGADKALADLTVRPFDKIQMGGKDVDRRPREVVRKTTDTLLTAHIENMIQRLAGGYVSDISHYASSTWENRNEWLTSETGMLNTMRRVLVPDDSQKLFVDRVTKDVLEQWAGTTLPLGVTLYHNLPSTGPPQPDGPPLERLPGFDVWQEDSLSDPRCRHYDPDITLMLLRAGADPMARNNDGNTPTHLAIECANVRALRILVKMGALIAGDRSRNIKRWSPLDTLGLSLHSKLDMICDPRNHNHVPTMMARFVSPVVKRTARNIRNKDYRNNVPKGIDSALLMAVYLWNACLWQQCRSYTSEWSLDDLEKVVGSFRENKIYSGPFPAPYSAVLTWDPEYLRGEDDSSLAIRAGTDQLSSERDKMEEDIRNLHLQIDSRLRELKMLEQRPGKESIQQEIVQLQSRLGNLLNSSRTTRNLLGGIQKQSSTIEDKAVTDVKTALQRGDFSYEGPMAFHKSVLHKAFGGTTTSQQFVAYESMWRSICITGVGIDKLENIGCLWVRYANRISRMDIAEWRKPENAAELQLVLRMYRHAKAGLGQLPGGKPVYWERSPVAKTIVDIATLTVKVTFGAGLYRSVLKALNEYIIANNKDALYKGAKINAATIVEKISGLQFNKRNLQQYMLDECLPRYIKKYLGILENGDDDDSEFKWETMTETILTALKLNPFYPITDTSTVYNQLNTGVFPYWRDMIETLLQAVRTSIEGWDRYLATTMAHLEMIATLNEHATV
jgi:ankyrin repeat protein